MIYDISMSIDENIQVYKNKESKKVHLLTASDFANSSVFESKIEMNLHTGTHIDFGKHVSPNGTISDDFPVDSLIHEVLVIDLSQLDRNIENEDLISQEIKSGDYVLLKTRNSQSEDFDFDFIALNESGALYLKEMGVKLVGTDGLGIERGQEGHPTHHLLLDNGIIIMEGLRLKNVPSGRYEMIALPLKIKGVEALPVRAMLRR